MINYKNNWENTIGFILTLNRGSFNESKNQSGFTHFCEHLMFSGTKKFSRTQLQQRIHLYFHELEAQTSRETLRIFCYFNKKDFREVVEILNEMLFHWKCTLNDFKAEKAILISEAKEFFESEEFEIQKTIIKLLPLPKEPAIGRLSDLQKIKVKDLRKLQNYWKSFLNKATRDLTVIGNLSKQEILSLQKFLKLEKRKEIGIWKNLPMEVFERKNLIGFYFKSNRPHFLDLLLSRILYWRGIGNFDYFRLKDINCFFTWVQTDDLDKKQKNDFLNMNISEEEFEFVRARLLVSINQINDVVDVVESLNWFNGFQERKYFPNIKDPKGVEKYFKNVKYQEFRKYLNKLTPLKK